ncbi:hypothetical protein HPB48_026299 [Haemaphysalis longicornis]|uniref:BLOC-1-related complex subunit 6 C-terminal helix domain-containing protein n=1 Tax=Haemaphysalis longicornis TaxID=44386 RepID=A0A9J6HB54_HAELO|nr:hypothetical protein HPB48_026299 [Haemaphysalis longicornis]
MTDSQVTTSSSLAEEVFEDSHAGAVASGLSELPGTLTYEGDMVTFVAEDLQQKIKLSSPTAKVTTVAKLAFEKRLSQIPDERWAREVFKYITYRCLRTKWVARTKHLGERYGIAAAGLTEPPRHNRRQKVRDQVATAELERWRKAALEKPALNIYSRNKTNIEKESIYDNARGSGLLCEARSGVLRTRVLRAKFTEGLDTTCSSCNQAEETVRHVVLECTELKPPAAVAVTEDLDVSASLSARADVQVALPDPLAMALGFHGPKQQPHWEAVEVTKRRLEHWWRKNITEGFRGNPFLSSCSSLSSVSRLGVVDPGALADLEAEARTVAASVETLLDSLTTAMHGVSSLTVDCMQLYERGITRTCDMADSDIKAMYQVMAKFEELTNSMRPLDGLVAQVYPLAPLNSRAVSRLVSSVLEPMLLRKCHFICLVKQKRHILHILKQSKTIYCTLLLLMSGIHKYFEGGRSESLFRSAFTMANHLKQVLLRDAT